MSSRGVNKVILVGNLTRDPEMKYLTSGEAIANFSVATSETWKDKTGAKKETTEFHSLAAFGALAKIIGEYARKGQQVYVEGSLKTRKFEHGGVTKYATEIRVNEFQLLGGKREAAEQNRPSTQEMNTFDDEFKDDIPFS